MPPSPQQPAAKAAEKSGLHPRNRHRDRYDFRQLTQSSPELAAFVFRNKYNLESIDFSNPAAVKALNRALLLEHYGIAQWDIPDGYLCPPIPGRADYLHYMADLLADSNNGVIPRGGAVRALDVGVGANCIYPILGHQEYGWHFVGSDVDPVALRSARQIVTSNPALSGAVECRLQTDPSGIFKGIILPGEVFDFSICNPPFHDSPEAAAAGTGRKWKNLGLAKVGASVLNFGGQNAELWCPGGEAAFIRRMIEQSMEIPSQCFWFSTLVSKQSNLPGVYRRLKKAKTWAVKTIDMTQGQKMSRIVAWTFLDERQQAAWRKKRWA